MSPAAGAVLLVGTRRGLFRFLSDAHRREWRLEGPHISGYEVYHAAFDPTDGRRAYAAVRHPVWGTHIYRSTDAGGSWSALAGRPAFPAAEARAVQAIWHLAVAHGRMYAGVQPAGLFASSDEGERWSWISALERHPTRAEWQPAKGGLALHSIQVDPRDPLRLYVALSAGGCYRSDDGGESWEAINGGVRADFLGEPDPLAGHCVHALRLHPALPDRLYQQNHCGVYRSDDRGENWTEISAGLPSEFGYVLEVDPRDPDRCWVVPEESSHFRCVCEARMRVYETRDAGKSWTVRSRGLPQENAYVSILREALATDGGSPCGLYVGTSTGQLFASPDGENWHPLPGALPKILSVSARIPR